MSLRNEIFLHSLKSHCDKPTYVILPFPQAPANHLLSASVMSAPAALAMAKLFYPETEKSKTTAKDVQVMEKRYYTSYKFKTLPGFKKQ